MPKFTSTSLSTMPATPSPVSFAASPVNPLVPRPAAQADYGFGGGIASLALILLSKIGTLT